MRTPRVLAAAVTAVTALALAACGSGSGKEATAEPSPAGDGKITIYSGRTEKLIKPLIENFEKASGVKVEVRYDDTAKLAAQLLEEGGKTKADLYFAQDAGGLGAVAKAGLFAALPKDVTSKVPAEYRAANDQWVGVTGRSRVLVYNSDLVQAADLPKTVFDLKDPRWKGKIGIAPTNGSFQSFVTAIRVSQGDDAAKAFLKNLKDNDVQSRSGNALIVEDVNSGKLAAGLVNHYYVYEKAKEKGTTPDGLKAKLHFFRGGDPGALVNVAGVGVLKQAAKDPDVRKFVDYLLSADGQKYFAEQTYEYPLVAGVATAPGLPSLKDLNPPKVDLNDLDSLQQTIAIIKGSGLVP
ncbi:iron ABC transporter substrate-binding protein [Longispora albida]|uniref:iron ABC transporter substrate-binding protein n=1 Tax=Longispora albida TaxID=203523 RepID=UPI00036C3FB1|nr:iron ABC transporter substrate-binding protein [Longispora albida]